MINTSSECMKPFCLSYSHMASAQVQSVRFSSYLTGSSLHSSFLTKIFF